MAALLNTRPDDRLWAVDKVILAYLALTGALVALYARQIPDAAVLLLLHLAGAALVLFAARREGRAVRLFRDWYPLPYVTLCYREMAIVIPAVRQTTADRWLAELDFAIWHAHPTVWLERLQTPLLTEALQVVYTLFVPVVLLVPFLLWRKRRYADFRYCTFLITLGFLVSYAGYLMVPARGPRFILAELQHAPLRGRWLFDAMQATLDRLESAHYDCFPSGHTELTLLAWWSSRSLSTRLFAAYSAYTICIMLATVYLRYHYTVDVGAGVLVAAALIVTAPALYRRLSAQGDPRGDH